MRPSRWWSKQAFDQSYCKRLFQKPLKPQTPITENIKRVSEIAAPARPSANNILTHEQNRLFCPSWVETECEVSRLTAYGRLVSFIIIVLCVYKTAPESMVAWQPNLILILKGQTCNNRIYICSYFQSATWFKMRFSAYTSIRLFRRPDGGQAGERFQRSRIDV